VGDAGDMSTPRIVEDNPFIALERLRGDSVSVQIVKQALNERDVLIQQLHTFRQDHKCTVAEMICECTRKLERLTALLSHHTEYEPQEEKHHG
jgi:hypothetical protein